LVRILDLILQQTEYNRQCDELHLVEHIIAVDLQVLSGSHPKDQWHMNGTSRSSAYLAVDDFVEAVNIAQELNIDMPQTPVECDTIYKQYKIKSTNEIMASCLRAINGFFQHTM
jgi:hypothetical protein